MKKQPWDHETDPAALAEANRRWAADYVRANPDSTFTSEYLALAGLDAQPSNNLDLI